MRQPSTGLALARWPGFSKVVRWRGDVVVLVVLVVWLCGCVVVWWCGGLVVWLCGCVVVWWFGGVVVWRGVVVWLCRCEVVRWRGGMVLWWWLWFGCAVVPSFC